jgi:hypothetical protein
LYCSSNESSAWQWHILLSLLRTYELCDAENDGVAYTSFFVIN